MKNPLIPIDGSTGAFRAQAEGLAREPEVRIGAAAELIAACAGEQGRGAIVVGTRGMGAVAGLAMGFRAGIVGRFLGRGTRSACGGTTADAVPHACVAVDFQLGDCR